MIEEVFDKMGICNKPSQTQKFEAGDIIMYDKRIPFHSYYKDFYENLNKTYVINEIFKRSDGYLVILKNDPMERKIFQDRFVLAKMDIFQDEGDFLL